MREIAPTLALVEGKQSHARAIRPALSHGRTLYPLAECSRVGLGNHDFSACRHAKAPSGPYPASPWSNAPESIQAPSALFAASHLQYEGEISELTAREGLDYPQMDKNTIWQTNSTYQSKDNEFRDENDSRSSSRIGNLGPLVHSGARVLWKEDEVCEGSKPERHTLQILIYLSFLSPFLTLMICLYTLLVSTTLIMLIPLNICVTRKPLRQQISDQLLPALHLQLQLIYSSCDTTTLPCTSLLVLVSVLSPVYAAAIAVAAWVAAVFWAYAGILGDPDGLGLAHDDGRTAVLRVRRWWERWLERAMKRKDSDQLI